MEHKHTIDTLKTKRGLLKERDGNTPALSQPKKPRYIYVITHFAIDEYIHTYICSSKKKAETLAKDLKQDKYDHIFVKKTYINLNISEFVKDI